MIAGVILAAGTSSRMGRPKPLIELRRTPLLQHVIDRADAAGLGEIVVVLGDTAAEIEARIELPLEARVVINPEYASGQSTSLRAGLAALGPEIEAAAILLGDQPLIAVEAIRRAAETYRRTGGPVVRTHYRGQPGHPVILDRAIWADVQTLEGDRGAGELLDGHPEWVVPLELDEPPPIDVDTPADLRPLEVDG